MYGLHMVQMINWQDFFSYTAIEEELTVTENYEEIKISIDEAIIPYRNINASDKY
jgi:hypothetical protein